MTAPVSWPSGFPMSAWYANGGAELRVEPATSHDNGKTPGQLWERVEESGAELDTYNGWLIVAVNEHTCGTDIGGYYGMHEPGCGYEPLYNFGGKRSIPDAEAAEEWARRELAKDLGELSS